MMIAIGEIVAAHGLRGEVRVQPHTDFPERFHDLETVWLILPNGNKRLYHVHCVKMHETKQLVILQFDEVRGQAKAKSLVGAVLQVDDEQAVSLPEGTYFEHDIIGLQVTTTDGRHLGPVTEILHTGANDVYVTDGALIPAIADVIREIDIAGGRILVEAIPGLIEE